MPLDEDLLYRKIGELVKQRRVDLGLGQAEVALAAGLTRTSISNLEKGRQRVPLHVLYKICSALDVEVSSILPPRVEVQELRTVPIDVREITPELPSITAEWLLELDEELQGSEK